ncbi:hypothetical protein BOX15_Mlig011689g1 [Macrostomum lignano]|uniref:FTP domain-containing protein n=1 Tax=Macrostomum lignano TaxID=282301 RepID=A0A267FSG9_9PLAT|nr:hypothetical protein BOX15_Mlig011689g1 [Macrostomum lignano]
MASRLEIIKLLWLQTLAALLLPSLSAASAQLSANSCSQSSDWSSGSVCGKAIDGNTNRNWNGGSCTATGDNNGWWEAQFDVTVRVDFVSLWNRANCCPHRLGNFQLLMDGAECASYSTSTPESVFNVSCGAGGRRLRVQSRTGDLLTICEIKIFGIVGEGFRFVSYRS